MLQSDYARGPQRLSPCSRAWSRSCWRSSIQWPRSTARDGTAGRSPLTAAREEPLPTARRESLLTAPKTQGDQKVKINKDFKKKEVSLFKKGKKEMTPAQICLPASPSPSSSVEGRFWTLPRDEKTRSLRVKFKQKLFLWEITMLTAADPEAQTEMGRPSL